MNNHNRSDNNNYSRPRSSRRSLVRYNSALRRREAGKGHQPFKELRSIEKRVCKPLSSSSTHWDSKHNESSSETLSWAQSFINRGRNLLKSMNEEELKFEKSIEEQRKRSQVREKYVNSLLKESDEAKSASPEPSNSRDESERYGTDTSFKNYEDTLNNSLAFTDKANSSAVSSLSSQFRESSGSALSASQPDDGIASERQNDARITEDDNVVIMLSDEESEYSDPSSAGSRQYDGPEDAEDAVQYPKEARNDLEDDNNSFGGTQGSSGVEVTVDLTSEEENLDQDENVSGYEDENEIEDEGENQDQDQDQDEDEDENENEEEEEEKEKKEDGGEDDDEEVDELEIEEVTGNETENENGEFSDPKSTGGSMQAERIETEDADMVQDEYEERNQYRTNDENDFKNTDSDFDTDNDQERHQSSDFGDQDNHEIPVSSATLPEDDEVNEAYSYEDIACRAINQVGRKQEAEAESSLSIGVSNGLGSHSYHELEDISDPNCAPQNDQVRSSASRENADSKPGAIADEYVLENLDGEKARLHEDQGVDSTVMISDDENISESLHLEQEGKNGTSNADFVEHPFHLRTTDAGEQSSFINDSAYFSCNTENFDIKATDILKGQNQKPDNYGSESNTPKSGRYALVYLDSYYNSSDENESASKINETAIEEYISPFDTDPFQRDEPEIEIQSLKKVMTALEVVPSSQVIMASNGSPSVAQEMAQEAGENSVGPCVVQASTDNKETDVQGFREAEMHLDNINISEISNIRDNDSAKNDNDNENDLNESSKGMPASNEPRNSCIEETLKAPEPVSDLKEADEILSPVGASDKVRAVFEGDAPLQSPSPVFIKSAKVLEERFEAIDSRQFREQGASPGDEKELEEYVTSFLEDPSEQEKSTAEKEKHVVSEFHESFLVEEMDNYREASVCGAIVTEPVVSCPESDEEQPTFFSAIANLTQEEEYSSVEVTIQQSSGSDRHLASSASSDSLQKASSFVEESTESETSTGSPQSFDSPFKRRYSESFTDTPQNDRNKRTKFSFTDFFKGGALENRGSQRKQRLLPNFGDQWKTLNFVPRLSLWRAHDGGKANILSKPHDLYTNVKSSLLGVAAKAKDRAASNIRHNIRRLEVPDIVYDADISTDTDSQQSNPESEQTGSGNAKERESYDWGDSEELRGPELSDSGPQNVVDESEIFISANAPVSFLNLSPASSSDSEYEHYVGKTTTCGHKTDTNAGLVVSGSLGSDDNKKEEKVEDSASLIGWMASGSSSVSGNPASSSQSSDSTSAGDVYSATRLPGKATTSGGPPSNNSNLRKSPDDIFSTASVENIAPTFGDFSRMDSRPEFTISNSSPSADTDSLSSYSGTDTESTISSSDDSDDEDDEEEKSAKLNKAFYSLSRRKLRSRLSRKGRQSRI